MEPDTAVTTGLTLADWIQAGVIVGVALIAAMLARRVVTVASRRWDAGPSVAPLVGRILSAVVIVAGLVYGLNALGVAIGPLLGALGVGGIALAFALQDILENLVAGLLLQVRRPFRIGDQVELGETVGTVRDVNLRAVVVRTLEGTEMTIPSADVLKNPIHNLTRHPQRRTSLAVGVGYDADLEEARAAILGAVRSVDEVADDPEPQAFVEAFGGSSVDFSVRFWHESPVIDMWRTRDRVAVAVKQALDDADIEIPYPQHTVRFPERLEVGERS